VKLYTDFLLAMLWFIFLLLFSIIAIMFNSSRKTLQLLPIYLDLTGSTIFFNIYYLKNVLCEISVLSSHRDEKNIADIIIPVSAVAKCADQN